MSKRRDVKIGCAGLTAGELPLSAVLVWAAWGPAVLTLPFSGGMGGKAVALLLCPALSWLLAGLWKDWGVVYGLLGAALLAAVFYRPVWQGVLLLLNAFLTAYSLSGGTALPFAVETASPVFVENLTFFLLLSVFCLLLSLCVRKRFWLGAVLLSGLPVVPTLAAGVPLPVFLPSALALAFCWSALICRAARAGGASFLCLVLPGAAILFLAAAALLWSQSGLTWEPEMAHGKALLAEVIDRVRYEGGDTLPLLAGGDLNSENTAFTGQTVLRVTMQKPQSVYWKGFTGGTYENGLWTPPEETGTVGGEYQGLLLYLACHGFTPQVQVGQTAAFQEDTATAWVTVENLAAGSKYLFAPYEAIPVSDLTAEYAGYQEEGGIRSGGIFGARKYTFSMSLTGVNDYALADLSAFLDAPTQEYREMERLYRTYVYDAYLDISEQDRALLQQCFDGEALARLRETDLAAVTKSIRAYFSEHYSFDYDAPAAGSGDVLADFIADRTGNQTHFATLAALIFREAGIPARYAEGYFLSPGDVAIYTAMPSIVFDLPDSSAHAWVEVYVNGFGWVPVEVTPGFYPEEEDGETVEDTADLLQENPEYFYRRDEPVPPPQEESEPPDEEPDSISFAWPWLLLLLLPVCCFAYRRIRKRRFYQADTRKALAALYVYTARLLKSAGCVLTPGSAYAGAQACGDRFDLPGGMTLTDFVLLVYAARFDREAPGEQDAEAARRYVSGLKARICGEKSWLWNIWSRIIGRV